GVVRDDRGVGQDSDDGIVVDGVAGDGGPEVRSDSSEGADLEAVALAIDIVAADQLVVAASRNARILAVVDAASSDTSVIAEDVHAINLIVGVGAARQAVERAI